MTYRSSAGFGGLGALTPENIAAFFQMYVGSGGCKGNAQVKANMAALQCLSLEQLQIFGQCYTGVAPKGVSNLAFYAACKDMAECGVLAKVGCPPAPSLGLPECATSQDMLNEMSMAYCEKYPAFNGPDAVKNTVCWGVTRYPQLYMKLKSFALCPPPAAATLVDNTATATPDSDPTGIQSGGQAPPPDTTAQATYDSYGPPESSATTVPTDDAVMPGSDCGSWGPNYTTDPVTGECVERKPAMSTTTMAMFGIGGVLALGAAYLLLRKKK